MKQLKLYMLIALLAGLSLSSFADINIEKGYAIEGYDTVAYFLEGKAIAGSKDFSYEWQGAKWLFSNKKNLESFEANPEKYAPQYGGYCAYAVAKGSKAPIDPKAFTVYKDKLYLNYSMGVRKQWVRAKDKYISQANENWKKLKK